MQPSMPTDPVTPAQPPAGQPSLPPLTTEQPFVASQTPQSPLQQAAPTSNDVSVTTNIATPAMADDGDLIEKEWVAKVKEVMRATQDNPFERSKQFTAVKADYMHKRYGKNIKTDS